MEYELTKHADDVVKAREIERVWLDTVIASPELTESDPEDVELEHRLGRIPDYGNRVLRVVLNVSKRPVQVVTAYFDRSMRNKI